MGAAPVPGVQARQFNPALLPPHDAPEEEPANSDGGPDWLNGICASLAHSLTSVDMRDPEQTQQAFREMARWRDAASRAAHQADGVPALSGLAYQLHFFLAEFERHVASGAIDPKAEGAEAAAMICAGLGLLSDLADAGAFTERTLKSLRVIACNLTGVLLHVIGAGMQRDAESADRLLAFSTWCSRALKARLLQSDDGNVRAGFRLLLDEIRGSTGPREEGDRSEPLLLSAQRLGICFVQLNTIRQFGLLHLEGENARARVNRAELQGVVKGLCGLLPQLPGNNGVQLANVGNTLKDFLDAGLLPETTHGWLMPAIAVLLQRMPGVPRNELLNRGGQVLANFGNFLRMLFELGLHRKASFTGCTAGYRDACNWMCGMLGAPGFALRGQVGQSLANLMSFVKAMARMEEQEAAHRQATLNRAARILLALLAREGMDCLSPMSISGLLHALAYLRARGMAPAQRCDALVRKLLEAMPSKAQRRWDAATVALSLRAIVQLQPMQPAQAGPMRAAYLLLLGLAGKHGVNDESHRLYCLQALRLGLQQAWSDINDHALQSALKSLLRWKGAQDPGLADLEAALSALAHRDEPAPARLEDLQAAQEDAQEEEASAPQPGTPAWVPPGGKLAGVSSAPELGHGRAQRSTTWRAPEASVSTADGATATATTTTTTSTALTTATASTVTASATNTASARQPGPARKPDPQTQWFELASSQRNDEASIQRLITLAQTHSQLVNLTDAGGYSGLYYAIVTGKPGLVRWLLKQADLPLGMALQSFRDAVEVGMLGAADPRAAQRAHALFVKAAARFEEGVEEEEANTAPADSSTTTHVPERKNAMTSPAPGARRKQAAKRQGTSDVVQAPKSYGDPEQRRQEWLRLAKNPNSGKAALKRMKQLVEIDPDLIDCGDDEGINALGHAITRHDKHRVAWLQPLFDNMLAKAVQPLAQMVGEMQASAAAFKTMHDARVLHRSAVAVSSTQPGVDDDIAQLEEAFTKDDKSRMSTLLNTRKGWNWAISCNSRGYNKLMLAVHVGKLEIVEALMERDDGTLEERVSPYGLTAFLMAAGLGHLDIVKVMLKHGTKKLPSQTTLNAKNALMIAAERGNLDCVNYLLAWQGGTLAQHCTIKGENALMIAARAGYLPVVQALCAHDKGRLLRQFGNDGENAMTAAAECGHAPVVQWLMGLLNPLDISSKGGCTPLHLAACEGHVDVLRVLLASQNGPLLVRFQTQRGQDALMLAAENGQLEAVKLLADFNGRCLLGKKAGDGTTCLMLAAKNNHADVVEALLALGGDDLALREDANGNTAFVIAAINNAVDVLSRMLSHDRALALHKLRAGHTALQRGLSMAYLHGSSEAVDFLREQAVSAPEAFQPAASGDQGSAWASH
jgi:ankyrin repeat protein